MKLNWIELNSIDAVFPDILSAEGKLFLPLSHLSSSPLFYFLPGVVLWKTCQAHRSHQREHGGNFNCFLYQSWEYEEKEAGEIHGKNILQRLDWVFSQHYVKFPKRADVGQRARSILSADLTLLLLASTCVLPRWGVAHLLQKKGEKNGSKGGNGNNNITRCTRRCVNSSESEASRKKEHMKEHPVLSHFM